jgi:hypothetical protein
MCCITLTDGITIINDMLNYISYYIICRRTDHEIGKSSSISSIVYRQLIIEVRLILKVTTEEWMKPTRAFVKHGYSPPASILMLDKPGRYLIENDLSTQGVIQGNPLAYCLHVRYIQL